MADDPGFWVALDQVTPWLTAQSRARMSATCRNARLIMQKTYGLSPLERLDKSILQRILLFLENTAHLRHLSCVSRRMRQIVLQSELGWKHYNELWKCGSIIKLGRSMSVLRMVTIKKRLGDNGLYLLPQRDCPVVAYLGHRTPKGIAASTVNFLTDMTNPDAISQTAAFFEQNFRPRLRPFVLKIRHCSRNDQPAADPDACKAAFYRLLDSLRGRLTTLHITHGKYLLHLGADFLLRLKQCYGIGSVILEGQIHDHALDLNDVLLGRAESNNSNNSERNEYGFQLKETNAHHIHSLLNFIRSRHAVRGRPHTGHLYVSMPGEELYDAVCTLMSQEFRTTPTARFSRQDRPMWWPFGEKFVANWGYTSMRADFHIDEYTMLRIEYYSMLNYGSTLYCGTYVYDPRLL